MNRQAVMRRLICLALVYSTTVEITQAAEERECVPDSSGNCPALVEIDKPLPLAGPEQVENRLHIDSNAVTPMFPSSFARGYFDWKDRIEKDHGVGFGGDYSFAYLSASDSPGADDAFGGMYRLFGSWEATSDGKGNSGALIWKIEHRHAYGNYASPQALASEIGYAGLRQVRQSMNAALVERRQRPVIDKVIETQILLGFKLRHAGRRIRTVATLRGDEIRRGPLVHRHQRIHVGKKCLCRTQVLVGQFVRLFINQ